MKVTIKGFLCAEYSKYTKETRFMFSDYRPTPDIWPGRVVIREHSFEVEISTDFDPRPGMVANLEEQKRAAKAACAARIKELNEQIQSLLAIEMSPTE